MMSSQSKLLKKKQINILSCYDATAASIAKLIPCDAILIGDSIGIIALGHKKITDTSFHAIQFFLKNIKKNTKLPLVVDLPKESMRSETLAVSHAKKLVSLGADFIKIEGHDENVNLIIKLKSHGIYVCAHIGSTPQKITQNKSPQQYAKIAQALEIAGADFFVLSNMSNDANKAVTKKVAIPSVGYKNYKSCNGKVEILYDALGLLKSNKLSIDIDQDSQAFKKIKKFFVK